MSRSSSASSISVGRRGPVKLGNMQLVHAPGYIFWKKKPKVDKLSLYLERIVGEKGDDVSQQDGAYDAKVQRVMERLYKMLFTDDLMFVKMFELPPTDFTASDIHLHRVSDREYECRLFLRRFVDQEAFQLLFGVQSDIPPGMAVYRTSPKLTAEQKAFLEDEWSPVMDGDGYMSPAKMYPWFAMGIANAITIIREDDNDNDNGNNEENDDTKNDEQASEFSGIEVVGDFPVVRLLFPSDGDTKADGNSDDVTLSVASSARTHEGDDTFNAETDRNHDGREPGNRNKETPGRISSRTPRKHATPASPQRPNAAHFKQGGRGDLSNRSAQHSGVEPGYGPLTVWSTESEEVISCDQDMADVPLMITIRPAIKGYGLPPSVKLQHGLPKQKPYCEKGLECIKDIQNKIEDGQSMWFLEASPIEHNSNVENSARFRSTFRKLGRGTKFWKLSLNPIEDVIKSYTWKAYAEHEFAIDLEVVKSSVRVMRVAQGWSCVTDQLIDTAILNVVKHNMLTMRSEGECCLKVLQYIQGAIGSSSCPGFLLPNVNMATKVSLQEANWVAKDIQKAVKEIERDPGHVMTFIGYNRRADESDTSLLH